MSEGEALIINKKFNRYCHGKKMLNNGSKGFLLTTKFYNSTNNADVLDPKKRNPEGRADVHL